MKKQLTRAFAVFGLVLMSAAFTSASAQTARTIFVHVPFEFVVGEKRLPAGDYTVRRILRDSEKTLLIRSADGRATATVHTSDAASGPPPRRRNWSSRSTASSISSRGSGRPAPTRPARSPSRAFSAASNASGPTAQRRTGDHAARSAPRVKEPSPSSAACAERSDESCAASGPPARERGRADFGLAPAPKFFFDGLSRRSCG